jgi:hypothetical protein
MDNSDTSQTLFFSRPEVLARVLALDEQGTPLWNPQELQGIWQHQLAAGIETDLSTVISSLAQEFEKSPELKPMRSLTFAELFAHPRPPVILLKLTKEFAKQTMRDADEAQLKEIASALYYASYAAGISHCGERIGSLDEREMKHGFQWAAKQTWLDDKTKALFAEGLHKLPTTKKV